MSGTRDSISDDFFRSGTSILWRTIHGERVGYVVPLRVIEDGPQLSVLYLAPGTVGKRRKGVRGGPRGRILVEDSGAYEDWIWERTHRLVLACPGDAFSVSLFWRVEDGAFLDWYIDLHEPLRRSRVGFDTRDHVLDAIVEPDRSSWRWKDEDEFAWSQETGRIAAGQAADIRRTGEVAVKRVLSREWPYEDRWRHWQPDPAWPLPSIPDGWDSVSCSSQVTR